MVNESLTQTDSLESLAVKITNYAKKYNLVSDSYLIGLVKSLINKTDLHIWSDLNPFDHFPRAAAKKHELITNVTKFMMIVRNVSVFIPIAVIWRAVGEATTQFEIYVSENSGAITNFLTFWQNGYGYLDYEYTIGHVAFVDFLIILGIIILTLILNLTGAVSDSIKAKEETELDREREQICLEIIRETYIFKKAEPTALQAVFSQSISQMLRLLEELKDLTQSSKVAVSALDQVAQNINQEQANWKSIDVPNFEDLNSMIEKLAGSLESLSNLSESKLSKSILDSTKQIDDVTKNLSATKLSIQKETKELNKELTKLKARLSRIKKPEIK